MGGPLLAQVNVARFRRPKDDPANAEYAAALDAVAAAAEGGPGLVWRFDLRSADAADRRLAADPHLFANLSVWTGIEPLRDFTYADPLHRAMMRRRREWFERAEITLALWWVPADERPTLRGALDRLARLGRDGPSPAAFTFARAFDAEGRPVEAGTRHAA